MSIPLSSTGNASNAATLVPDTSKSKDDSATTSVAAKARADLNVSIVQASLTVSIASGNDSLTLAFKSAITGINEALKGDFGDNAIQNAAGQDNTPDGTASRIVQLSTAFYGAYAAQHKGEDEATTRKNFVDTIRGGVEQGFKEAKDILGGLGVLQGDIAGNIDKTYDLVQKGLDAFLANVGGAAAAGTAGAVATSGVASTAGAAGTAGVASTSATVSASGDVRNYGTSATVPADSEPISLTPINETA